ncbi:MAG: 4-phosphoerythronate dehydrogenase, partial [Mariprofundaceae bacterium]|nr:4-phosphoerythronate dehydrogenase [Mariprofundaceae bacterium]
MSLKKIRIIADEHIWCVEQAFESLAGFDVNLTTLPLHQITSDVVHDADVLLTRSGIQVDAKLLQDSTVRFAGTATIGDDHYDKAWLNEQGITWATAAGSSTISVVEYMLASLFEMQAQGRVDFNTMSLGIIGVGRIGGLLAHVCERLGIHVLRNDPPRQRCEGSADFVSLDDLLKQADVITLHTPLIREGIDKTELLLNAHHLARFHGQGIINAARGQCVDNQALLHWLNADEKHWTIMDCWQHEPNILLPLLTHEQCRLATPHIAGHSLDGKAANTQYIYRALCAYLNIEETWDMESALPPITCMADEHESWDTL